MGRTLRDAAGGLFYHVMNRANGRRACSTSLKPADFKAFERVLSEAAETQEAQAALERLAHPAPRDHGNG
jgi:hypothetical protein